MVLQGDAAARVTAPAMRLTPCKADTCFLHYTDVGPRDRGSLPGQPPTSLNSVILMNLAS